MSRPTTEAHDAPGVGVPLALPQQASAPGSGAAPATGPEPADAVQRPPADAVQRPVAAGPNRVRHRLAALDGLRFVAALAVAITHFVGVGSPWWHRSTVHLFPHLQYVASYGFFGVQLFFLISGFVICMSSWGRSLSAFFVSRVVRLYPAYWIGVAVTSLVLLRWQLVYPKPRATTILVDLTMFNIPLGAPSVDRVYWTLWAEMRFYLLFALVIWHGLTYRRTVVFCALWLVGSLIAADSHEPLLMTVFQPGASEYFIAGIAIYLMYRFRPTILLWAFVVACFLMAQYDTLGPIKDNSGAMNHPHMPWWPAGVLVTMFFALLLGIALGWLNWVRGRWLTVLGTMTYPFYLLHQVLGLTVISLLSRHVPSDLLLAGTIGGLMLLAWLVHRFVERPVAPRLKTALREALAEMKRRSVVPAQGGG